LCKGLIIQSISRPDIVNPLSVSVQSSGKKRLILDLRHVYTHVWKQKVKFDDWRVALDYYTKGCFMFGFDLKSGYHHIEMFHDHCKYLGFAWSVNGIKKFYYFQVLPFGLSSAPFIFTKCMRPLVRRWRELGLFIVVFLDDGWCAAKSEIECGRQSEMVKSDLLAAGFVPNVEKSHWLPSQSIDWLGMHWDGCLGSFAISVKRIKDIHISIQSFINDLPRSTPRSLASMMGKIIALKPVMGNIVQLKTRYLHHAILSRYHWDDELYMTKFQQAIEEVFFWKHNVDLLNIGFLPVISIPQVLVFTDASSSGFGAIVPSKTSNSLKCSHSWNEGEKLKSSTWRELRALFIAILSFAPVIKGKTVKVHTDNQGVASICTKGSMVLELQKIALEIFSQCKKDRISLEVVWIPRSENEAADLLSRMVDYDDWGVSCEFFKFMDGIWGPHTVDRFADHLNAKIPNFNSKYWCPNTSQVDAFAINWSSDNNWLVPPISAIPAVIRHMVACKAEGTLVVPIWPSACFWPLLFSSFSRFYYLVRHCIQFSDPAHIFVQGRNMNALFGSSFFTSKVMCIKLVG
jgi:hypothetical protein